jgi:hypothetical protein
LQQKKNTQLSKIKSFRERRVVPKQVASELARGPRSAEKRATEPELDWQTKMSFIENKVTQESERNRK